MSIHQHAPGTRRNLRRILRAQWRDAIVLLGESSSALLLFFALVLGGSLLFYTDPIIREKFAFSEVLYGTFVLLFFENTLGFPHQWYLQILYFIIPILGLIVVADGVIRFGVALTNKKERGQKWQIAMASTYTNHTIVCGLGKIGYRVILELLKYNRDVVAIEIDPKGRFVEKVKAMGIPVILEDARRAENLIKAGIERADAVIPCTNDELANLDIGLDARELNPEVKLVLRMYDPDLAQRVEKGFGIHTAFSSSALAAPIFAAASMRINVKSSFYAGDKLLYIGESAIKEGARIEGWTIQKLEGELDLCVVSYIQGGVTHLRPDPELRLNAGGHILVLASLETLHLLEGLSRP